MVRPPEITLTTLHFRVQTLERDVRGIRSRLTRIEAALWTAATGLIGLLLTKVL